MNAVKRVLKTILYVLPALIFILAIGIIISVSTAFKKNTVPSIFGYSCMTVLTNSMENTIMTDDFIVVKKCKDYKVDDIVSFYYDQDNDETTPDITITHRIIRINEDGTYVLHGDNVSDINQNQVIYKDAIIGKVIYVSGSLGSFFSKDLLKNKDFLFVIVISLLVLFMIYQVANIIKIAKDKDEEDTSNNSHKSEDEDNNG